MKVILLLSVMMGAVMSVCPNGCSGHGRCESGSCVCFDSAGIGEGKSYTGNDCSLLKCPEGNPLFVSGSSYPESSGSDFGIFIRELYLSDESRSLESTESTMTLLDSAIDETTGLWKVSANDDFFYPFPKTGGAITCGIYKDGKEDITEDQEVEVVGVKDDKKTAYLKFGEKINADKKTFKCNKIVSIRKSMVHYGPDHKVSSVTAGRQLQEGPTGTIKWSKYGKMFADLGILQVPPTPPAERRNLDAITYTNDNFKFVCYTSSNELVEYSAKASYTDGGADEISFVLAVGDKTTLDTANSYCYCLMNANAKETTIEKTELNEIVSSTDKHVIGKFLKSDQVEEYDENGYPVITLTTEVKVTSNNQELEVSSEFIVNGRVVYVDILKGGIVIEKEVTVDSSKKISITNENGGIILPYIKMHSSNPTTDTTPIIYGDSLVTGSYFYKVYSLNDVMISQLNENVGGKLQCSYGQSNDAVVAVVADVKGYKKSTSKKYVLYSYIQFPSEITSGNINTVKCSKIISKRKDFTLYNPLKLDTNNGNYVIDEDSSTGTLTWAGYKDIFTDNPLEFDKVKFACYTPKIEKSQSKEEIIVYGITKIEKQSEPEGNSNVAFTIGNTDEPKYPADKDICYLVATSDGKELDLSNSDLSEFIRYDNVEKNYYYGKYEKPKDNGISVEQGENGNPVFILDNTNNKINKDTSTITIIDKELTSDDLEYFKIGQTVYIEVAGGDKIPYYHKATIVSQPPTRERLLAEEKKVYFSPKLPTGVEPTGVILTSLSSEPITPSPVDTNQKLYNIKGFYGNLVSQLPKRFGGILQCKYIQRKGNDDRIESMGFVDVKGYGEDKDNNDDFYGYFQFDRKVSANSPPDDAEYYINEIECNDIVSSRNDMSLYNPTISNGGDTITWSKYGKILNSIGITSINSKSSFACYNRTADNNKKIITEYATTTVTIDSSNEGDKVEFQFVSGPKSGDICYLLADENGNPINIESSELFEFVRKGDDGNYYYGKYEDVDAGKSKIIVNDDGSQTIVLGKDLLITKEGNDTKDKINIAKLNNPDSPSIAYPPSLISDGIKKLMIPGTVIRFTVGGKNYESQIIKIGMNDKGNKFEILLSKAVGYMIDDGKARLLNNIRLLVPTINSIVMTFTNEKSTHKPIECSGQGICNRESGLCDCYNGYSGSACQRLDCPNKCNGNGRCVALSELLNNDEISNNYHGFGNKHTLDYKDESGNSKSFEFDDQIFGCLCDKRHRGYDCSLIECPSDIDPEEATNNGAGKEYRDCSGRGICNYESGICECFDGFSGEGCQIQIETM